MGVLAEVSDEPAASPRVRAGRDPVAAGLALAAFAVLCALVLSFAPRLVEPDDYAYRASIVAMTQGHFLTLSTAQVRCPGRAVARPGGLVTGGGPAPAGIPQWVQLPDGRWISEKDPGYPFLAAPFQALGIIRLAPLFYGALGCLGLYVGARRWLGRWGGPAAVGLFCSSGAAVLFAWRDYMPTFTDASLIAAGTGALLWAVLATEASPARRTGAGLAGFVALEAATFVRYTDIVVLGCAAVAVTVAWRIRAARLPAAALAWWLGSVAVFGAGVAGFDDRVYGGPLTSGYRPGEITFSLGAVLPNLRYMPAHLIEAVPMLVLGAAGLGWIIGRWDRGKNPVAVLGHRDQAQGARPGPGSADQPDGVRHREPVPVRGDPRHRSVRGTPFRVQSSSVATRRGGSTWMKYSRPKSSLSRKSGNMPCSSGNWLR